MNRLCRRLGWLLAVVVLVAGCETPSPHTISRNYSTREGMPVDPPRELDGRVRRRRGRGAIVQDVLRLMPQCPPAGRAPVQQLSRGGDAHARPGLSHRQGIPADHVFSAAMGQRRPTDTPGGAFAKAVRLPPADRRTTGRRPHAQAGGAAEWARSLPGRRPGGRTSTAACRGDTCCPTPPLGPA